LLKAGLMEIGDVFAVNKADRPDASRLYADLTAMLGGTRNEAPAHHADVTVDESGTGSAPVLAARPDSGIAPKVHLLSAERNQGVVGFVDHLEALAASHTPRWQDVRQQSVVRDVQDAVIEHAIRRLRDAQARLDPDGDVTRAILEARTTLEAAAQQLLDHA
jgi:putative protein kinase ArgK-like GTPase of G3E family